MIERDYTHLSIALEETMAYSKFYKPQNVLEIGSGKNNFDEVFTPKNYTAIDIDESSSLGTVLRDVHDMKYKNEFDFIFMCHAAEHFINPILAWTNIYNALEKGGTVVSITPDCCEHQILKGDVDHLFVLNPMQWEKILYYCGFRNIRSYVKMTFKNKQIPYKQDYCIITTGEKL